MLEYAGYPGGEAFGALNSGSGGPDLPSLDHAVMWVLRRTAPDVWRAERPHVWRVWTRHIPADPFHPAGWAWFAAPVNRHNDELEPPPLASGPNTPDKGDRAWIRHRAHQRATQDQEHGR